MTKHLPSVSGILFLLIFAASGLCQVATTSLRGLVTDQSGAVIPGAAVTLVNTTTEFTLTTRSNSGGEYGFSQLPPAKYTIKVTAKGFADQAKSAELLVNQPATVNFSLSVETSQVVVNVSAEAQTLNQTDASLGNSVSNAVIESLPMEGRNVTDLLSLQPGVLYLGRAADKDSDSRTGAVAGARSDQTDVTLDGIDDNDQNNGYAFTGVLRSTLDSTEEFRVTTAQSNADAGRTSGAQVALVTKSGTNNFHGSLYEYNRNTFTVANDWFNKQAELSQGLPNVPGKLIRNTFGGSFGGPLKKNKLYFFSNYEGQRTAEDKQVTQTAPTASFKAGNITYPNDAAGDLTTLSPAQVATMDPNCPGTGTCPWGQGDDPNVLTLMSSYPTANGTALGDGLNFGSFTFSSPYPGSLNTVIFKLDATPTDRHHLFVRGNLQKDTQAGTLNFPGQPPSTFYDDNTKGILAGDAWTITPNLVNDLRYGFIRQGYIQSGLINADYIFFRSIAEPTANTFTSIIHVPVQNVVDTLSWDKGSHSLQFGGNWRLVNNERDSNYSSFSYAETNIEWIDTGGDIANTGSSFDPAQFGYPAVCCGGAPTGGFTNSYAIAIGTLAGLVPEVVGNYNYRVISNGTTGNQLPDGTTLDRHFRANEFEYYLQDSWRMKPNLTITYGVRHTILQTPYEVNGQEVAPTVGLDQWFRNRYLAAYNGTVDQPDISFAPAGRFYGRPGYWPKQKANFAPRIAFAYGPDTKTSIRGGFGIYFDHYGEGIVNSFDQLGSFGLSTSITNPAGTYNVDTSPRFTSTSALPPNACGQPASIIYPYNPPNDINCGLAITWGIDNKLKTPYAESFNLSLQRELPHGFTVEADYVGRLGRHLLQQLDLAEPAPLSDGGVGYFAAATELSKLADANGDDPNAQVPAIPYFEDLFPDAAGLDTAGDGTVGNSATQNIYTDVWALNRGNETTALYDMDVFCYPGCGGQNYRYFQDQFSSLYAWATIGMSYYNAGQIIIRHPMSNGLQFDFSYTLSTSIDMGSDTERSSELSLGENSPLGNPAMSFSEIVNSYQPSLNRGFSDFDTRHLITFDWVDDLPIGRDQRWLGNGNRAVNAFIGGWQWSGLSRWSSGLPFNVIDPAYPTDWQTNANMVETAPIKLQKHIVNGAPQVFAGNGATEINNGVANGTPMRNPYPGEAGERNNFRGDGYFDIDSALHKTWKIREGQTLAFAWEVFNVTNSVRFDTNPVSIYGGLNQNVGEGTLGDYSSTLSLPRVQQFSLRYDF